MVSSKYKLALQVYASEEIQITDENIVISDEDTPAQELIIKIVTKPTYGNLINTEQSEGKLYYVEGK